MTNEAINCMATLLEIEELPIRVNTRGEWLHGDKPLHPKVEILFRESVRINEDGTYRIEMGRNKSPIEVEDVAFFVRSMQLEFSESETLESVELKLSDGTNEALNPGTLMQSESNVFYCRLERDGFWVPCRFPPAAYHELLLHAEMVDSKVLLQIGNDQFQIQEYNPTPEPT